MIISEFCSGFCDQRWQETNNCCNRQIENRIDGENHKQNWCGKLQTNPILQLASGSDVANCEAILCCKHEGDWMNAFGSWLSLGTTLDYLD